MVAVAQLVEPLIVIQVVAGSSPVGRPIFSQCRFPSKIWLSGICFCFRARLNLRLDPA